MSQNLRTWTIAGVAAAAALAAGFFSYGKLTQFSRKTAYESNQKLSQPKDDTRISQAGPRSFRGYLWELNPRQITISTDDNFHHRFAVSPDTIYTCAPRFFRDKHGIVRDVLEGYLDYSRYSPPSPADVAPSRVGLAGQKLFLNHVKPGRPITAIIGDAGKSAVEIIYHSNQECEF